MAEKDILEITNCQTLNWPVQILLKTLIIVSLMSHNMWCYVSPQISFSELDLSTVFVVLSTVFKE